MLRRCVNWLGNFCEYNIRLYDCSTSSKVVSPIIRHSIHLSLWVLPPRDDNDNYYIINIARRSIVISVIRRNEDAVTVVQLNHVGLPPDRYLYIYISLPGSRRSLLVPTTLSLYINEIFAIFVDAHPRSWNNLWSSRWQLTTVPLAARRPVLFYFIYFIYLFVYLTPQLRLLLRCINSNNGRSWDIDQGPITFSVVVVGQYALGRTQSLHGVNIHINATLWVLLSEMSKSLRCFVLGFFCLNYSFNNNLII